VSNGGGQPGHNIAIIPARGGSKRIPRKNIRLLGADPLVAWTVNAARSAPHIDRVVVSTEDPEIAELAGAAGAEVVHRPLALADDSTPAINVVLHTCEDIGVVDDDVICMLLPTSPFRTADHIETALALWQRSQTGGTGRRGSVVSVTERSELLRTLRVVNDDGMLQPVRIPGKLVESNGAIQISGWNALRLHGSFHVDAIPFFMNAQEGLDIDTALDWAAAEAHARQRASDEPDT
jgi:CMP-N,N'-diacetyllegionaminic acid synthase